MFMRKRWRAMSKSDGIINASDYFTFFITSIDSSPAFLTWSHILVKKIILAISTITLTACSASTSFNTLHNSSIEVKDVGVADPKKSYSLSTTSFGQYPFKLENESHEDFYGILPLKFNGGYLALDILFFAPATLFNLREVYPQYQFDIVEGVVKYRRTPEQSWREYKPTEAEVKRISE